MIFPVGATSQSVDVQIVDDSGLPVTGLVAATFPTLTYSLAGANADVAFPALSDLATITTAYASGGVKERTNGYYRLDLPNGVFTTAGQVRIMGEATGKHVICPALDVGTVITPGTGAGQLATTGGDVTVGTNNDKTGYSLTQTFPPNFAALGISATGHISTVDTLTTYTGNTPQTGDSYARIGAGGASLNAVPDTGGTTTLLSRLTAARAGYFDNLNVGGPVASHADVVAINLSATKHLLLSTVGQYEPGETYTIEMRTFAAADGSAVNADTTPTLTATGQVSGSLNANLSAATNPATGVYRWTYAPGATPTLEQIRFDGAAVINTGTFTLSCFTQTVDFATAVYSATDQAHLTSIFNKLPANNIADETLLLAAIGSPQQVGTKYAVTLNSNDVTGNVPAHVLEWNGTAVAGPPPDKIFISSHLALSATSNTITLSATEPATDNYYRDHLILIVSGTGAGQSAIITGYVGATNVATIDGTWAVTPDATSLYVIMVGAVSVLAASQAFYAPAKAGDAMALTTGERTTLAGAVMSDVTDTVGADVVSVLAGINSLTGANAIETGLGLLQSQRIILAGICGVLTTAGQNPEVYKNPAGTATRISVANDTAGNRTAVTLTP